MIAESSGSMSPTNRAASFHPAMLLLEQARAHRHTFGLARAAYAERLAPDFNIFQLFNAGYELKLSQALAWLLDPKGSHGQGDAFLALFINLLDSGLSATELTRARIQVEEAIPPNGRLDIIIRTPELVVAIENKPWAAHQHEQMKRYLDYLEGVSQSEKVLVYVPGPNVGLAAGLLPSSAQFTAAGVKFRALSWAGGRQSVCLGQDEEASTVPLLDWLERCRVASRAPRVTTVIEDLKAFLAYTFDGVRDVTESTSLAELMSNSNVEDVFAVAQALPTLKRNLLRKLEEQVRGLLPDDWRVEGDLAATGDYAKLMLRWPGMSGYAFAMEFSNASGAHHRFLYGLRRDQETSMVGAEEGERLRKAMSGRFTGKTAWWPAYEYGTEAGDESGSRLAARDWTLDPTPWKAITEGTLAVRIVALAMEVQGVLQTTPASVLDFPATTQPAEQEPEAPPSRG